MKKMYIAPEFEILVTNVEAPIATSFNANGPSIGNGGTGSDTDDPDVKADNFWGDEEW